MSLLEHRLGVPDVGPSTEECRVESCGEPMFAKQAFKAPTGELCTVGLCIHHYGMRDILPDAAAR